MTSKTTTLLAACALVTLTAGQAGAAVYFFELGSSNHGNAQNAPPVAGATAFYLSEPGPPNVYNPQSIPFAEGTLDFSGVNSWSEFGQPPIGDDYWFTASDGPSNITMTLNLSDGSGNTTATVEIWTGAPDRTDILQNYAGLDATGTPYSVTTVNAPGDESAITPALGPGAVITATSIASTDIRIAGVRITTTTIPEPSTGLLFGLMGCLALLRRRR